MKLNYQFLSIVLLGLSCTASGQQPVGTKTVNFGALNLTIPSEMQIEKVATDPLVKWPIVADWDAQGRLVVAESGGVSKPIVEHNKLGLHKIVRLVDRDGDGVFDDRIVAAKDLAFPEGVLCVGNSILVAAPPEILKLTDVDGDGVCEQREVWHDGKTITGCANDLHGPYMGRDGWIYWCKGAFAEQTYTLLNGKTLVTKASHIFRKRLSGGALEPVMSGGMDNPVEVAITPEGERFFTSTFLQHPGDGKRDGMAHAIYGGLYGKDNATAIEGHVRTGPLMPITTHLGPAAPSGLICLESNTLLTAPTIAPTPERVLVAALFNLQRVTMHRLKPTGGSFVTEDQNLVVSDRIDFHPTDVIEDADGSLLIIDTGGWYGLCCPSSKVDQAAAQGGIYRLSSASTRAVRDARGVQLRWDSITADIATERLADQRAWVRKKAAQWLVANASQSRPVLAAKLRDAKAPLVQRLESLWTLCKIGDKPALTEIVGALSLETASLRHAAAHAISVERFQEGRNVLQSLVVGDSSPQVRRAAAEALGRIGTSDSIDSLMSAMLKVSDDRGLEHSLLYAMIEINAPEQIEKYLSSQEPALVRAALVVLDQSKAADRIKPAQVFAVMRSNSTSLVSTARDILSRQSHWAEQSIGELKELFGKAARSPLDREALVAIVPSWASQAPVQKLLGQWIHEAALTSAQSQDVLIDLLAGISAANAAKEWGPGIASWLKSADAKQRMHLAQWLARIDVKQFANEKLTQAILDLANESADRPASSLRFISALPVGTRTSQGTLSRLTVEQFLNVDARDNLQLATEAIGRLQLEPEDVEKLLQSLDRVEPLRLLPAITAISRLSDDQLDVRLLDRLTTLPAARTISTELLKNLYRNRSSKLRQHVDQVTSKLSRPSEDVAAKVEAMLEKLKPGDPVRGYQVFRSAKAACSACHRVGYVGGNIGPELSRIGASRTRRDLLEAILFPSSRLEQSYQPTKILTDDGQIHNGLIKRDTDSEIELQTAADKVVTIPTASIEQRELSNLSIMPAGLEELISLEDLADLLALLEAAK